MTNNDLVQYMRKEALEQIPAIWEPLAFGLFFVVGMLIGNLIFAEPVFSIRDMLIAYSAYLYGSFYMRRLWINRSKKQKL